MLAPLTSLLFFLEQGRSYYALPAIALPLAAGVVATGRWLTSRRRVALLLVPVTLQIAALVLVAPLVWPVLPERTMIDRGIWQQTFYKDEIGWPELVATTARAWRAIPAPQRSDTALLAQNYGEAGALALFGPRDGLPEPLSGHLSFQYWRPAMLPQHRILAVGIDPSQLGRLCSSWHVVARIDNAWHLGNEERGRVIARCHLRGALGALWQKEIASDRL